jgi:outer membrane protein OmpA-like peptidoglycan-associated protein
MNNTYTMKVLYAILLLLPLFQLRAQYDEIPLVNPSFEGTPARGSWEYAFTLQGWMDCAPYYFRHQTPPDVQPGTMEFFDVTTLPREGGTYLGMVTRQNETWELVSQRLLKPLKRSQCYAFEIDLARSETYISQLLNAVDTTREYNFNKPVVLRIWGGRNVYEKRELLAESPAVEHTEWRTYAFEFNVKQDHDYLILEAFYKTPTLLPYNGNILLDNASPVIRQIACPGEEELFVQLETLEAPAAEKKADKITQPARRTLSREESRPQETKEPRMEKKEPEQRKPANQPRILAELDKDKLREGQIIRIQQLYFAADSSNFTTDSYRVLDEIFQFLKENPGVVIEVGGHTNGIPGQEYCQTLSLKRAKAVADYLYDKGIPESRITFKGYGKQRPIASNKTHLGRQKNQRVEIKILKLG